MEFVNMFKIKNQSVHVMTFSSLVEKQEPCHTAPLDLVSGAWLVSLISFEGLHNNEGRQSWASALRMFSLVETGVEWQRRTKGNTGVTLFREFFNTLVQ